MRNNDEPGKEGKFYRITENFHKQLNTSSFSAIKVTCRLVAIHQFITFLLHRFNKSTCGLYKKKMTLWNKTIPCLLWIMIISIGESVPVPNGGSSSNDNIIYNDMVTGRSIMQTLQLQTSLRGVPRSENVSYKK